MDTAIVDFAGIGPMVAGEKATMAIEGLGELTNKVSAQ